MVKFKFLRIRKFLKILFYLSLLPLGLYVSLYVLDYFFPFPEHLLKPAGYSMEICDRNGELLMSFLDQQSQWNFPVPLQEIAPILRQSLISAEDKHFYKHAGVDLVALVRAFIGNITGWRRYSGASTITMQTIRLLEPRPRCLRSKIIEAFRAWQLERLVSKDQILEIYLNLTPYGSNLIGIEAASRRYFDKSASSLTLAEASLLAGLPQSPSGYRPDRHFEKAIKRRSYVLRRLEADGIISKEEQTLVDQEKPSIAKYSRHFSAAHWCMMMKESHRAYKGKLQTSLDLRIQEIAQECLRHGLARYLWKDIENGAVIVMENRTGKIRAWIGSANFFSSEIQGQINGGRAIRSPGSLLKPFTYLLAFQNGLLHPGSILHDVDLGRPDYRPSNYDRQFYGPVSARFALRESLNIPAIRVQQELGTETLLNFYRSLGISSLEHEAGYYGLTLTLGTCEATLLELVNAYATLARQGTYVPPQWMEEPSLTEVVEAKTIFSPEAAYLVHSILRDVEPLKRAGMYIAENAPQFAWKTGTSSGQKDAWAMVYNPEYTIGVWLGNFDNRSSKNLVGIEAAMPIAYQILQEIVRLYPGSWYLQPAAVQKQQICIRSGDMPQPGLCQQIQEEWRIIGKSPQYACRVHQQLLLDSTKTWAVCDACKGKEFHSQIIEVWPEHVRAWLQENIGLSKIPSHFPDCPRNISTKVVIAKPIANTQFTLGPDEKQHIELQAFAGPQATLYWFQDGVLIGKTISGKSLYHCLEKGKHQLSCSNEHGDQASVQIQIR